MSFTIPKKSVNNIITDLITKLSLLVEPAEDEPVDTDEVASETTPPSQIEATPSADAADVTPTLAPPTTQATPTEQEVSQVSTPEPELRYEPEVKLQNKLV